MSLQWLFSTVAEAKDPLACFNIHFMLLSLLLLLHNLHLHDLHYRLWFRKHCYRHRHSLVRMNVLHNIRHANFPRLRWGSYHLHHRLHHPRPLLRLPPLPQRRIQSGIHCHEIMTPVPPSMARALRISVHDVHAQRHEARRAHPRRVPVDGLPGAQPTDESSLPVPETVPLVLVDLGDAHGLVRVFGAAMEAEADEVELPRVARGVLALEGPELALLPGSE
mmetsp:Transcript_13582/g.32886  ORF Transcript_13582/g.32886 Transcript_13582/m.32886 type:complete len:221 (+) Transcript_13582:53-715(+)